MITISKLTKNYTSGALTKNSFPALKDVSFSVVSGEVFGIIGLNGAGKSTLLKILMGFIGADSGEALVSGYPPGSVAAKKTTGFLPENPSLYGHLTPAEHLNFSCRIHGLQVNRCKQEIKFALEEVDLLESANKPIRQFSKGMKQRVSLAIALLLQPKILILDEPMSGLDPFGRELVINIIEKANIYGTTILFCSHILSDIERICDRIGILDRGALLTTLTPDSLKDQVKNPKSNRTLLESYLFQILPKELP